MTDKNTDNANYTKPKRIMKTIKQISTTFNVSERTPDEIYKQLDKEFNFNYDPCPLNPNWTKDGLTTGWGTRCFVNPPYGREIPKWLNKAQEELLKQTELIVFLLPAYTDVKWFHELLVEAEIRFIKGRLKFGEHKNTAPFASMIVILTALEEAKE